MYTSDNKLIHNIKKVFNTELPGIKSHYKMMPIQRKLDLPENKPNDKTKTSSVLLLLYPENKDLFLVFIKRQQYEGIHSGQVAFPGGKKDKTDKNFIETALRETKEEIGINTKDVEILGKLSELYIPPSNFVVYPYLGFIPYKPDFNIDTIEVADIFSVGLHEILNSNPLPDFEFEVMKNKKVKAPCFVFGNYHVWGATSMILNEFIDCITTISEKNITEK